jgi:predicted ATPase
MARRDPGYYTDVRFLRRIGLKSIRDADKYPYNIPAIRQMGMLELHEDVTFFVGENGSGKSTLIEAIAVDAIAYEEGFPVGGGTPYNHFGSFAANHGELHLHIDRTVRCRGMAGFFLRAESFYNVATDVEALAEEHGSRALRSVGGRSLHKISHGESFMALIANQFDGGGLFVLDEPEAALSPNRLLVLLGLIDTLARRQRSQFIIATHSPILLAYPHATIYELSTEGIRQVAYEDTEHYKVTLDFLRNRDAYMRRLCGDDEDG